MLRGVCVCVGGECAWVCVAERGVCVVGRGRCTSVNSKAGNCRTCVIAFQPTMQRVVCLLLFLRVIVNCTVTLLSTHTHTRTQLYIVCCFFGGRLHSIGKHCSPRRVCDWNWRRFGRRRPRPRTVWGMWQLWHNWQLTAVATFAQAAHAALTAPAISEEANQRQATHVTLQFIYMYFEACNKIKFINSQRQRREEELQPPTRQSRNSFSGRAKLSRACECVFIHSKRFIRICNSLAWSKFSLGSSAFPLSCCCLRQFMRITFSHFREWLNIVYSAATPSYGPCGRDVGACNLLGPWRKILFNHLASEKFSS